MPRRKRQTVNKSQAIRDALAQAGPDPSPTGVAKSLQARGIDVSPNMVSLIKGKMKAQKGAQGKTRVFARNGAGSFGIDDVVALRELTKKIGKENVRRLVEALGD
jgi:hypothetical protein